jgi:hypothetical protein
VLLQVLAQASAAELNEELHARLLLQCDRSSYPVIRGLQVRVDGETMVIHCASLADRLTVLNSLMGALRWQIADLGLPATIHVTGTPRIEPEPPGGGGQPTNGVPPSA